MRLPAARKSAYGLCLYRAWGRLGLSAIGGKAGLYSGSKTTAATLVLLSLSTSGCSVWRGEGFGFFTKSEKEVTGAIAS